MASKATKKRQPTLPVEGMARKSVPELDGLLNEAVKLRDKAIEAGNRAQAKNDEVDTLLDRLREKKILSYDVEAFLRGESVKVYTYEDDDGRTRNVWQTRKQSTKIRLEKNSPDADGE